MADSQTSLNITDIADAVKLIDFIAEGGTFKGWEVIRHALSVRDRLEAFVVAANAQVNSPPTTLD